MSNVFMNFENSKTSDHHRILINLSDKMNLKRSDTLRSLIDVGCGIEGERGGWNKHQKLIVGGRGLE